MKAKKKVAKKTSSRDKYSTHEDGRVMPVTRYRLKRTRVSNRRARYLVVKADNTALPVGLKLLPVAADVVHRYVKLRVIGGRRHGLELSMPDLRLKRLVCGENVVWDGRILLPDYNRIP